jgi:hypothetical protein
MSKYSTTSVTVVGHSLGAALALLSTVYLPLHLPSGTDVKMIGYGLPRVGNPAFANYVDAHAHVTHVHNKKDPVPLLPPLVLGFRHPAGEVHIDYPTGTWYSCPGQESTSDLCELGDAPNFLAGNISDHAGPYDGVLMGC